MIISLEKIKASANCESMTDAQIIDKIESIEDIIRNYCNNNFQNRAIRFYTAIKSNYLLYCSPFVQDGDTLQISDSAVNDGVYSVTAESDGRIKLNKPVFDNDYQMLTKIEYPATVINTAAELFKWSVEKGDKVGIKSETLSRHSVTYEDSTAFIMGYPKAIISGLNAFKCARC